MTPEKLQAIKGRFSLNNAVMGRGPQWQQDIRDLLDEVERLRGMEQKFIKRKVELGEVYRSRDRLRLEVERLRAFGEKMIGEWADCQPALIEEYGCTKNLSYERFHREHEEFKAELEGKPILSNR